MFFMVHLKCTLYKVHVALYINLFFFFVLGQAMGGTLTALASIVTLAVSEDVTTNALSYFLIADVFILLCIISFLLLPNYAYSRWE